MGRFYNNVNYANEGAWRSLRSSCNILITITAIADVIHHCGHLLWAYLYFNDIQTNLFQCFHIQNLPFSGAHLGCIMLLIIAVDRVFCMTKPIAYQGLNKLCYITTLMLFAFTLPIGLGYYAYNRMLLNQTAPAICMVAGGYDDESLGLVFEVYLGLSIVTLLAYGLIWLIVRMRRYSKSRQLLRSVTVVSLCVVGGWFISMVLMNAMPFMGVTVNTLNSMYAGFALNLSVALNYFIYYAMNREYRCAFIEQIRIMTCGCVDCRSSKIGDSNAQSTRRSVNSHTESL
ncbi:unnamed protein product [Bursaphelenchus xylophilus]|uniref:(pine wood nematode) hypothetical protein n=1 Tax=Bursaphelenchus xylophilus TaxID=6326 RepID=A0A811KD96_BURXY|nr:unnamed protein product [Bursaphelenchus xylophilus]CAG9094230.1 unnamed protein product [Bursaphelenchus xylophilus]